jgi:AdoMet-dependent heme synthase
MHPMMPGNFAERPLLVFWETTKACPLACAHCRAHAQPGPAPGELSTKEGLRFIEDLAGFGDPRPILVITGGDPLARPDVFDLIAHARANDIRVGLAPAVSPAIGDSALDRLADLGVRSVSISLDGATAATHDGIRLVPGHFAETVEALKALVARGFMVQVNTTVMLKNAAELADIAALLARIGVSVWEVFFLVHVGRGTDIAELSPAACEDVVHFLYDSASYGFIVRTVEAPFFRRVATWRAALAPDVDPAEHFGLGPLYRSLSARLRQSRGAPTAVPRAQTSGTRDGNGILFVAHDGSVCPAGFLPLALGNVRTSNVVDLYRTHPLLLAIRRGEFGGRCGPCEYARLCGGSRSRAFAASGDPLGEDPACAYVPLAMRPAGEQDARRP